MTSDFSSEISVYQTVPPNEIYAKEGGSAAIINKEGAQVQKADCHYSKHLKCMFVNYNFNYFLLSLTRKYN